MPPDPDLLARALLQAITLAVLLTAWASLLIPIFPGLIVMWLATLLYALIESSAGHMAVIDWVLFAVITLLAIVGEIVDNIIIARRLRGHHVPWRSIVLAYVAGLIASIFLTPLIGILASPLALFAAESARLRNRKRGFQSARLYMIAWGWAFAAVFTIGALMIAFWVLWAFF